MRQLRLTEKVDLDVYCEAEFARLDPEMRKAAGITLERAHAVYGDCPSRGFECDGHPIGGIILDRDRLFGDVHFAVLPAYHGLWQPLWAPALEWVFSHRDPAEVHVPRDNGRCLAFMNRQWEPLRILDDRVVYRISSKNEMQSRRSIPSRSHAGGAVAIDQW